MSARARLQLVQLAAVAGVGLVRVTWSQAWGCYLVTEPATWRAFLFVDLS